MGTCRCGGRPLRGSGRPVPVAVVADASGCGRAALRWSADLAVEDGRELHVVTCHRLRWHAASLPPQQVAQLAADHELATLAAADDVLHGSGLRWQFHSAGARPLRAVVPEEALVVVATHGGRCGDRLGALRTLPGARSAAADLRGRPVLHVGRAGSDGAAVPVARRRRRAPSTSGDLPRQTAISLPSACYCGASLTE